MVSFAIATLIVIQNLVSSSNLVCSDYEQCKEQNINGYHSVTCSGYNSCENAPLIGTTGGDLQCDGYFSCAGSDISMPGGTHDTLLCHGSHSCQYGNIDAGNLRCGGSQSCQGNPSITATYAYCNGYYSCTPKGTIQQTIFAAKSIYCLGSNSCQGWGGSLKIEGVLICGGYQSCKSDTIEYSGTGDVGLSTYCSGDGSCMNTVISSVSRLFLYGSMAAYGADIKGVSLIEAYGRNSLYGATVDSDGVVGVDSAGISMTVRMYGLGAGYNTDVICRSGDTCKIYCKGDACERTTFRCLDGATCNVSPKRCEKEGVTEYNGVFCPIMTDSEPSITTNKMRVSYSLNMDDNNNPEITSDENIYQCDSPHFCEANTFHATHNQALCYGAESCNDIISNVPTKIDCFGDNSCGLAKVRSSGTGASPDLNCNGKQSCENVRYDATPQDVDTGAISCNGYASCRSIEPISGGTAYAKKIRCNGESSCNRMKYILDDVSGFLRCDGYRSCQSADIFTGRYLGCYGSSSCKGALIRMTGNQDIECHGDRACCRASIDTDKAVYVYGYRGAEKTTISASTLAVQGYLGIAHATIDSGNRNIFVSLYGHFSGKGATLICQQGSTCTLRCYGTACKEMDYVCLNTDLNNCKLEPSACSTGTNSVVNGIDCPTFGTTLLEKEDEEVDDEEEEDMDYERDMEFQMNAELLEDIGYAEEEEMIQGVPSEDIEMDAELFGDIGEKKEMIIATPEPAIFHMVMVVALFVIGLVGLIYAVLRAMKSSNKNEYQSLV